MNDEHKATNISYKAFLAARQDANLSVDNGRVCSYDQWYETSEERRIEIIEHLYGLSNLTYERYFELRRQASRRQSGDVDREEWNSYSSYGKNLILTILTKSVEKYEQEELKLLDVMWGAW